MATANTNTFTLTIDAEVVPPVITQNPTPSTATVTEPDPVSTTTAATGATSSQWYKGTSGDTSTPVVGQTTNTLTIDPTEAADTGTYYNRYTNAAGSTDTTNYTLTVNGAASAPTVDAGGPYSGQATIAIALDATVTQGTDPSPTLTWSVQSGPDTDSAQFSSTTIEDPTFTPSTDGAYVLKLAVNANDWPEVSDTANLTASAAPAITTQLMLHGGYTAGTETIIDSSSFNRTVQQVAAKKITYESDPNAFKLTSMACSASGGNGELWQPDVDWGSSFTVEGFSRVWNGSYTVDSPVAQNYNGPTYPGGTAAFKLSIKNYNMELLWNGFTRINTATPVGADYEQFYWALVFDATLQQFRLYMGIKGGQATLEGTFNTGTSPAWTNGWYMNLGSATELNYAEDIRISDGVLYTDAFTVPTTPLDPQAVYTAPSGVNAGGPYQDDQNVAIPITATYDGGNAAIPTLLWESNRPGEGDFDDASAASTTFTPTGTGAYILTFTVTSHEGSDSDTANLTSNVLGTPISFDGDIPNATLVVDVAMSNTDVSGNWSGTLTPFDFTSIGTALPPGINLSSNGVLSGTPTVVALTSGHVIQGEDTESNTAPSNAFSINVIDTPAGLGGIYAGTQGPVRRIWAGDDEVDRVFAGETLVWQKAGILASVNATIASLDGVETMSMDISGWDIRDGDMIICGAVSRGGTDGTLPRPIDIVPDTVDWTIFASKTDISQFPGSYSWSYVDSDRATGLTSIDIISDQGTSIVDVAAIAIHVRGFNYPYNQAPSERFSSSGEMADPPEVTISSSSEQLVICSGCVFNTGYVNTISHQGFEMVDALPQIVFSQQSEPNVGLLDPDPYESTPVDPNEPPWGAVTIVLDRS